MARLGVFLLLVVALMTDAASLWSGGVEWGTATTPRANAYWQPGTAVPTGRVFPDVAIDGVLVTGSLMSATWSLGISDYLADMSPNSASLSFTGQVSAVPGDDLVISTPLGVAWVGRVDTLSQTRDTAGDWWTTISATDRLGALGAAVLDAWTFAGGMTLKTLGEELANDANIPLIIEDGSVSGLVNLTDGPAAYSGTVLDIINKAARTSNAMVALRRDGDLYAVVRESVTPSSVLTLSGANAPTSWTLSTSIDGLITKVLIWSSAVGSPMYFGDNFSDNALRYGERPWDAGDFERDSSMDTPFDDWNQYWNGETFYYPDGAPPRPVVSAELVVASWSQDDLILLNPLEWVTESSEDWQVLSVQHNVTPNEWRVSITADNLLDILVDIP